MSPSKNEVSERDAAALVAGLHPDPFGILGPHEQEGGAVIRVFAPGARKVSARLANGESVALDERGAPGFFEGFAPLRPPFAYRLHAENDGGAWDWDDPYRFGPILGPMDDYLLVEGAHLQLYARLGAHKMNHEGVDGVHFSVWAPNARRVSVVGAFNQWDGRRHPLRKRIDSGLWEIFIPEIAEGELYKFEILGASGQVLPLKADPFGLEAQLRPSTASVVACDIGFNWTDADYLEMRATRDPRRRPMSIYEVHLGSWRRGEDNRFLTYDELADSLIPYVRDHGFTHLELLPISEHPLDASWGYQPIGLFAPTSRFGDADGLRALRRSRPCCGHWRHPRLGAGAFPDRRTWAGLVRRTRRFTNMPTRAGDFIPTGRPRSMISAAAKSPIFSPSTRSTGSSAFMSTACASTPSLRCSISIIRARKANGRPTPRAATRIFEAVAFLQTVNTLVYERYPGALMIAEESTSWPGVSQPVHAGGLGFGFKWNMGWMNDTLRYMAQDPIYRRWAHDRLTFGLLYAFSENFILPISHDEVVHGKGSIIGKMPGDEWRKFANARAYYAFMWGHPGKKLLFMGQEFGQTGEWSEARSLDWHLLQYAPHAGLSLLVRDLNILYRETPALYARDCEAEGFQWLAVDDADQSVFAWLRRGGPQDPPVAVVVNFTPVPRPDYRIGLPAAGRWREILNTDAAVYGGGGLGNFGAVQAVAEPWGGQPASAQVMAPPLGAAYFLFEPEKSKD